MSGTHETYFIPDGSRWPVVGSISLCLTFVGAAMMLNGSGFGTFLLGMGIAAVIYMFAGWFADVIDESLAGNYSKQVDVSFRWGMAWFIFSEVMFFAAFFGALYYVRIFSVPWLGGEGAGFLTNFYLWPEFEASWPLSTIPDPDAGFSEFEHVVPWNDLPLINTIILLTSGVTLTFAHHALKKGHRNPLCWWLLATVVLGFFFVYLQAGEYQHAYHENLKLTSGIYGSTFYMLTGFHGFHVCMGATMLLVIYFRCMKGHFTPDNHFGFEGVAWYWHFVDVVWLGLFIFVYII